jgi:type II secretory pathway component GspD/PulD (secretin)
MKKQIIISLFMLTVFGIGSAFAQEKSANKEKLADKIREINAELRSSTEKPCEAFGKYDFEGTRVSFTLVDAELNDFLVLANPFGCNFVIDEKVEKARTKIESVKVDNVPWNLAVQSVLQSLDLAIEIEDSNFRIVESSNNRERQVVAGSVFANVSLYTGFVRLEYLALEKPYWSNCFPKTGKVGANKYTDLQKFLNLLKKLLSSRGVIEIDGRSNTLIITDEEDRVKKVSEFVKLLDESGFTLEEIVNNPDLEIK